MSAFGLLGAAGQADEAAEYALPRLPLFRAVSPEYLVAGRDDLIDIGTEDALALDTAVVAAVGAPAVRRELVEAWGGSRYLTVASSRSWVASTAVVADGCILAPFAAVSSNARLGAHVLVNLHASVSHDAVIGEFVTLSPGARVGGRSRLGDGVFVGIGATVMNDVAVASGIIIGAGAVVVSDLTEPGVYIGVPAKRLRAQEGWLRAI